MGITIGEKTHFNGKTGAALPASEDRVGAADGGGTYRHLRCAITTDARGAAGLSLSGLALLAAGSRRLRLDVSAGDRDHLYGGSGGVPLEADGTGDIEVKLLPNTHYYLWLYCDGWCDLFRDTELRILPWGSYGTKATAVSPGGFFGEPVPISLRDGSAGGLYTVTLSCAGRSETLQVRGSATDLRWTPALETYAALLPESGAALAVVSCESFYGGVSVGTRTGSFLLRFAPGSLAPQLSPGWASAAYDNSGGAAAPIAAWVQGHSRALVSFDETKIACRHGARIASYTLVCGEETVTAAPYRTGVLAGTAATLLCTVTDSRGQRASETLTLSLYPYSPPALAGAAVVRADGNGDEDPNGDRLRVYAEAAVSPIGGLNPGTLAVRTRTPGGAWSEQGTLTPGTARLLAGFSPDMTWDVQLELSDALGNTARWEQRLATRVWAMKLRPDGSGAAFGKAAEHALSLEFPASWTLRFGEKQLRPDMLGPAEPGASAAENHAAGEYFLWQGSFVEAACAIAAGDALSGRVTPTSAAAALTALRAALGRLGTQTAALDGLSVPPGSRSFTIPAARQGYTPLGVLGFRVLPATADGANSAYVCVCGASLSGTGAELRVRNEHPTDDARIRLEADILYI